MDYPKNFDDPFNILKDVLVKVRPREVVGLAFKKRKKKGGS